MIKFYALQTQELFFLFKQFKLWNIYIYTYVYICVWVCIYIYIEREREIKYIFIERNILFWLDKEWKSNILLNFAHLIHFTQTKFNFEHSI